MTMRPGMQKDLPTSAVPLGDAVRAGDVAGRSWPGLGVLPASVRYNLAHESVYAVTAGLVSGLILLAQVMVVAALGGGPEVAMVMTAALPSTSLLQPLWAEAARRVRLQTLALCSGTLRLAPLALLGWADDAWTCAALVVLYYVAASANALAVPSLYRYTYPDSHRGRIIGWLRLVQNGVAMPVMLGCAALLDWQVSFRAVLFPGAAALALVGIWFYSRLRIPGDDPEGRRRFSERATWRSMRLVLRQDSHFRLFQATIFLTGAGFLMSRPIWLYLLREHFAVSQVEMTLLVQVMPILLGAVTSPAWGWLIDKTSPVAGRVAFAWLGVLAYLALFGSFMFGWLSLAYAGAILRGLVLGAAEVATTAGNLYFSLRPERAALYESISSVFQGIRGLIMPVVGWGLYLVLHAGLFLVPTALNAWSLVLSLRLYHMDREHRRAQGIGRSVLDEQ